MYVGFISVEKTSKRYEWSQHHGPSVYYTPWFDSRTETEDYVKELIHLHPNNNIEINDGKLHDFDIHYIIFRLNQGSFDTLRRMTSALEADWYKTAILKVGDNNE